MQLPLTRQGRARGTGRLAPEIGTRPAGLRDRPGRTCDHRGDVVGGALGEAAAFRLVREGKGEADEVPSVKTTPSPLKSDGSNGPWLTVEKSRVVAAAFALFSEPHVGDASSTGLLGGVADAGPAPRTMLAAATTSVHTSRGATYSQVPEVHPCGLSSGERPLATTDGLTSLAARSALHRHGGQGNLLLNRRQQPFCLSHDETRPTAYATDQDPTGVHCSEH